MQWLHFPRIFLMCDCVHRCFMPTKPLILRLDSERSEGSLATTENLAILSKSSFRWTQPSSLQRSTRIFPCLSLQLKNKVKFQFFVWFWVIPSVNQSNALKFVTPSEQLSGPASTLVVTELHDPNRLCHLLLPCCLGRQQHPRLASSLRA